jgi:membrane protein
MKIPARQALGLLKQTASAWSADYAPSMGAALAYYTLFSIAPLVLIVISVAGFIFGADAARGEIFGELAGLIGDEGAKAVEGLLAAADKPRQGVVSSIVGVLVLVLGATTVFGELQNDLDRIWRAPARAQATGWFKLVRSRLLSLGMVLGIAFLLMVSLIMSAALSALGKWWGAAGWQALAQGLDLIVSFGLTTVLFALIYKYIPRVHIRWRDVWVGAAVTAALFAVGKWLIGLYLGKSSTASAFVAAGSLVVLMHWVYYSAQIFLFGAEFTWVYAHEYGSRRGQPRPGTQPEEQHPAPLLPQPAANSALPGPVKKPGLRKRHPFGSLGVAFVAGIGLGVAKSLGERALGRRST